MQAEATEELFTGECCVDFPAIAPIILHAEANFPVCDFQDPVIGDGHTVSVLSEITDHRLWLAEGGNTSAPGMGDNYRVRVANVP